MSDAPDATPLSGDLQQIGEVTLYRVIEGEGLPVVFLHGIPTSSYLWRNVQRRLATRYRTLAPDLLGLGRSPAPPGSDVRLEHQARLVARLLDALGIARAVLVAHDIGGAVAHHFAAAQPERVLALVVMNIAAFAESWPVPLVKAMRAPLLGDVAALVPSDWLLRQELARGLFHRERMTDEVFAHYAGPLSGLGGRLRFLRFIRGMDAPAAEAALMAYKDATFPRLILWGEDDVFQPIRHGRRLHELWGGSTFVPIAQAGHFLQEDQPARLAGEIDRFLTALPRG
jgi:pimeloyl-ACP methyl ester carboxylesterase